MKNVAINGFGRIGRMVFRELVKDKNIKVVAINDLTDPKTLAHLLKYDTAHGRFPHSVSDSANELVVDHHKIPVFAKRVPQNLPWKKLNVDLVVESTGFFRTEESASQHLIAGAKKVLISAPAKGNVKTIVYGVNHKTLSSTDKIVSAASCTTNCLAPVVYALDKAFGIATGFMTTVHAYTGDQRLQDAPHADLRRSRAAASNIIPTTTGAAIAVGKVLPHLAGKLDGIALRVPVLTGSVVDLVFVPKDPNTTTAAINKAIAQNTSATLAYLEDPVVSSDIIGATHGSLFDSLLTKELSGENGRSMFKVIAWYDNESSYVNQYVRTLQHLLNL